MRDSLYIGVPRLRDQYKKWMDACGDCDQWGWYNYSSGPKEWLSKTGEKAEEEWRRRLRLKLV